MSVFAGRHLLADAACLDMILSLCYNPPMIKCKPAWTLQSACRSQAHRLGCSAASTAWPPFSAASEDAGPAGAAGGADDKDAGAFKSNAKGAAVARAFARIMEKTRPDDRGLGILSVGVELQEHTFS